MLHEQMTIAAAETTTSQVRTVRFQIATDTLLIYSLRADAQTRLDDSYCHQFLLPLMLLEVVALITTTVAVGTGHPIQS